MTGLSQGGRDAHVADFQRPEIESVDGSDARWCPPWPGSARGIPLPAGRRGGQPVGLLTLENIGEYLMVRTALAGAPARASRPALAES